ncbi:MAG: NADH:ubiquinone reductase (Na(+)-transporting) subunit B [Bacteroidales bacterium]|nr:NADH:ubiquinone reductase (Na(+)-transporting) subunit B [Bacteroidales bacterium]
MKALREYIDKIKPHFEKGGKFEKLHSVFDGFETFLFVPNRVTTRGSHIRDAIDMKRTMATVVLAMFPALLFGIWNVGYQHFQVTESMPEFWTIVGYGLIKVLPIVVVSYVTGLAIEFFFAQIRGHEINEGFLVSGMLIPLVLPPTIPLWMVALATAFAVILGKEVFGGTGMNILNPALTARAFLFFAYPAYMSGDKVWIAENAADATTGATPLAEAAAGNSDSLPDFWNMFFGFIPGSIGETSTALIIVGAIILLFTGVGSWRIMLTAILGGLTMGLLFNLWGANEFMQIPAHHQLVMGGFAFGVVFMATDPVSATQTTKGKYIYGFLIGFLGILIRVFNPAYPEGIMLAILFMNVMSPLIDHYVIQANIKHRMKRAKLNSA